MKKISIAIENPCHEDWNRMTPEKQGRFCNSCEKIVIDFSEMSDSEILQFFNKPKTEKICGRFKSEQLIQKTESTTPTKTWEQSIFPSATNHTTSNPKPPIQLLHFAYILVLVLGIGVSSCNSETTKGEILLGDTTAVVDTLGTSETTKGKILLGDTIAVVDTLGEETNQIKNLKKVDKQSRILGKPKIQQIEKIEPIIMGECVMPYEYDNRDESQ